MTERFDVVVVGAGNAGLSAALSAQEAGARVCVIDRAPHPWVGGNSRFSAGAFRAAYASLAEISDLLDLDDRDAAAIDLPPYGPDAYYADILRVTRGRSDPGLARILADESTEGIRWLAGHGVRWELLFVRQSFRVGERIRFWGNLTLGSTGGGIGLVEAELAAARRAGIEVRFDAALLELVRGEGRVTGVRYDGPGGEHGIEAGAVVLASGGFEADARRRAAHLGPGWDLAKVRGTPYNTGDGIFRALEAGAAAAGHWSGCHAIAWDAAAPPHGDLELTNRFSRQAYPFGLVVNQDGRRFVDEGADFRNYTYAKYGAEILRQPGAVAHQLFDTTTLPYISRVDYDTAVASRHEAGTIAELAAMLDIDAAALEETVASFNAGVQPGTFDPTIKDGKGTHGVEPPKSNWAMRLESPPFVAFSVACGITFTFGGVQIDANGRILDPGGRAIAGLYGCGELVGLFHHNYPGGSGLSAGTVFGRRAGRTAVMDLRASPTVAPQRTAIAPAGEPEAPVIGKAGATNRHS